MTSRRISGLVIAAVLSSSACLQKEVSQTWYLDPTGAVAWVVIEKDVRSDAQAPADRHEEELSWYEAVTRENHPMARGFRALGAANLRTRILRSEVPFTVVTEGRFAGLDELGQRIISTSGLAGTSVIRRDGNASEWTFTVRDPHAEALKPNEDVVALLGDLDKLQVVLVRGRFESAQLMEISDDRRVAKFNQAQTKEMDENAMVVIKLRWTFR